MKCQHHSGCNEIAARGRLHLCIKHRDEHTEEKMRLQNERGTAKKQAWRVLNPVRCRVRGCTNPVEGKSHRCPACKAAIAAKEQITDMIRLRIYAENEAMANKESKPEKPKPREKPEPIMTDAQQEQINREVAERSRAGRTQVNQSMLMQRMMRGAIVATFDTGHSSRPQVEYQPPQRVSFYATSQSSSWD